MKTFITSIEIVNKQIAMVLKGLGFNDTNSIVLAQISDKSLLLSWSGWMSKNCVACKYDPSTCLFFSPEKVVGISKEEVLNFNTKKVEEDFNSKCPLLSVET